MKRTAYTIVGFTFVLTLALAPGAPAQQQQHQEHHPEGTPASQDKPAMTATEEQGQAPMTLLLIKWGAEVNSNQGNVFFNPLGIAIIKKRVAAVAALIEQEVFIDENVLAHARAHGNQEIITMLQNEYAKRHPARCVIQ